MTTPLTLTEDERQQLRQLVGAIRTGCKRYPKQAHGAFVLGKDALCVLGAAYAGASTTLSNHTDILWSLRGQFPVLNKEIRHNAVHSTAPMHPLLATMMNLNDVAGWTREAIADWLESLTTPTPEATP